MKDYQWMMKVGFEERYLEQDHFLLKQIYQEKIIRFVGNEDDNQFTRTENM